MISLVTRPGSAPTLAIALRNHVFQGLTSACSHCYRFECESYLIKRSRMCVLLYLTIQQLAREVIDYLLFSVG